MVRPQRHVAAPTPRAPEARGGRPGRTGGTGPPRPLPPTQMNPGVPNDQLIRAVSFHHHRATYLRVASARSSLVVLPRRMTRARMW